MANKPEFGFDLGDYAHSEGVRRAAAKKIDEARQRAATEEDFLKKIDGELENSEALRIVPVYRRSLMVSSPPSGPVRPEPRLWPHRKR